MTRRLAFALAVAALLMATLLPSASAAGTSGQARFQRYDISGKQANLSNLPSQKLGNRVITIAVGLQGNPVAFYEGQAIDSGRTMSDAQKLGVRTALALQQRHVATQLRTLGAVIQARFTDVFNAFAV